MTKVLELYGKFNEIFYPKIYKNHCTKHLHAYILYSTARIKVLAIASSGQKQLLLSCFFCSFIQAN